MRRPLRAKVRQILKWVGFSLAILYTLLTLLFVSLTLMHGRTFQFDYGFFYYAFQVVLHHKSAVTLYDIAAQKSFFTHVHLPFLPDDQYVYPPSFAVFWTPLALLPFRTSADVWTGISILLYGLGFYWMSRTIWPKLPRMGAVMLGLLAINITSFEYDILVGNANSIVFACVALTFYLQFRLNRARLAGVPLGFAILFKVTPLAILVYLVLRRKWQTSIATCLTVLGFCAFVSIILGPTSLVHYVKIFLRLGNRSMKNGPSPYNESLLGVMELLRRHHVIQWTPSTEHLVFYVFTFVVAFVLLAALRKRHAFTLLDVALAGLTPILFSPLVEQTYFLFALPALLILIRYIRIRVHKVSPTERWQRAKHSLLLVLMYAILIDVTFPVYLLLSETARHHPSSLFWLYTNLFWVMLVLFITLIWQLFRTKRNGAGTFNGNSQEL